MRFERHDFARGRVLKFQPRSVQKLTVERKFLLLYAVNGVADYGMTEMLCVYPYLMRSASLKVETA